MASLNSVPTLKTGSSRAQSPGRAVALCEGSEGSLCETFKVAPQDPSTLLRSAQDDGLAEIRSRVPLLQTAPALRVSLRRILRSSFCLTPEYRRACGW